MAMPGLPAASVGDEARDAVRTASPMLRASEGQPAFVPQRGVNSMALGIGMGSAQSLPAAASGSGYPHSGDAFSGTAFPAAEGSSEIDMLQRRIDAEVAAKESSKSELEALTRSVEMHLRQITGACSTAQGTPTQACVDRVVRNVMALCSEMSDKQRQWNSLPSYDAGHNTPRESYEVLRESLAKTQRRCATLNDEMLQVADANEELMSDMHKVKGESRRLVDQIQSQSEDIARLTQMRLADEENIENTSHKHRENVEAWRRDLQHKIADTQAEHEDAFQKKREPLVSKLRFMQDELRSLAQKLNVLRTKRADAADEARDLLEDWRIQVLDVVKRKLNEKIEKQRLKDESLTVQLEDEVHARKTQLDMEKETRQREDEVWQEREQHLTLELQNLKSSTSSDIGRRSEELQNIEAARESDAKLSERQSSNMAEHLRDLAMQTETLRAKLDASRTAFSTLDNKCIHLDGERQQLEETWRTTSETLRRSEMALDASVAGAEELRKTMDAQRNDASSQCDKDVQQCVDESEAALKHQREIHQKEAVALSREIERLEHAMSSRTAEVTRLEFGLERRSAERATSQRDCTLWKAQEDLAVRLRDEVQQELDNSRRDWDKQLQSMHEQQDTMTAKQLAHEEELRKAKHRMEEFKREIELHNNQSQSHATSLDAAYQEADEALTSTKRELHDKAALLASIKSEASSERTAALEAHHDLQKELNHLAQEAADFRDGITAEINKEWQKAQRAQQECEELHQRSQLIQQETQSGPVAQIAALQQSISEIRDRHRLVLKQRDMKGESNNKEAARLEEELNHAQAQLHEAEKHLQHDTLKIRQTRAEHEAALEKLKSESVTTKELADNTRSEHSKLLVVLDESYRKTSAERTRQERELAEATRTCEQQAREANARFQAERRRREADLAAEEDRLRADVEKQRLSVDAAEAESRRLRRMTSDGRGLS